MNAFYGGLTPRNQQELGGSGGGAVNSVSAANTTLTVSPTTGAVLVGINLSNANDWIGQQTFSANPRLRSVAVTGAQAFLQLETESASGAYASFVGEGTTVPGAVTGWKRNALFCDTDATTFNRAWINTGDGTSAAFRRIAILNTSGQLAFEDGTAALPIFTTANDPDSGMFSGGANILAFSTGGTSRIQINSGTNINFSLPLNFSSGTAPTAATYGIGRGATDQTYNVPTGAIHQDRVNGTNVTTSGVAGFAIVPGGSAAAPSLTIGGFQSGLYLTAGANTAISSQGAAVAEFINGGRMDFLTGGAGVVAGNFSIGRNTTNTEIYLNAPTGNVISSRINNVLIAQVTANTLLNRTGTTTKYAAVGGKVYENTTTTGNVGTGEDVLASYTIAASLLGLDNQSMTIRASGTFANNSNNKRVRINFGGQVAFDTGVLSVTTGTDWVLEITIVRTGAATQKCYGTFTSNAVGATQVADYAATTVTLSSSQTLTITGEGTADNDIVHQVSEIFHNQASA